MHVGDRRGADRPAARHGRTAVLGGRGPARRGPGADPRRRPALPRPLEARKPARRVGRLPGPRDRPRPGRLGPVGRQDDPRRVGARRPPARRRAPAQDGTLDLPRARLVAEVFEELSDENCARAEELLLPELTTPPRKTYTQIERAATAIAAAVDPGLAERRRKSAEKHGSRVTMFREGLARPGCRAATCPPTRPWPRSRTSPPAPSSTKTPVHSPASGSTASARPPTWTSSTASTQTSASPPEPSAPKPTPTPTPTTDDADADDGPVDDHAGLFRAATARAWAGLAAPATSVTAAARPPTTATSPTKTISPTTGSSPTTTSQAAASPTTASPDTTAGLAAVPAGGDASTTAPERPRPPRDRRSCGRPRTAAYPDGLGPPARHPPRPGRTPR